MFTGIVEEVGTVERYERRGIDAVLRIRAQTVLEGTVLGDSIAINGVCLTVTELHQASFSVDISGETLRRTGLGDHRVGEQLNLERSLAFNGRVGGHFVQGHIDGVGTVAQVMPEGRGKIIRIATAPAIMRYAVAKGYIAVDGMSLTVIEPDEQSFAVAFIPYTLTHSVAQFYRPGVVVNLEVDVLGKYVERFLTNRRDGTGGVTWDVLQQHGFIA